MKKHYFIWAIFPDGLETRIEAHTSKQRAQNAVDAMENANKRELAEGNGFPHGVPVYEIRE